MSKRAPASTSLEGMLTTSSPARTLHGLTRTMFCSSRSMRKSRCVCRGWSNYLVCRDAGEWMMVRPLGMSGVEVSAIGLGGYELGDGDNLTIERAREIVTASLDAGVNWLDTAEVYLDTRNETAIGEAIVGIRDELIVATKVAPAPDGTGLRARADRGGVSSEPEASAHRPDRCLRRSSAGRGRRRSARGDLGRDGAPRGRRARPRDRPVQLRDGRYRDLSREPAGRRDPAGAIADRSRGGATGGHALRRTGDRGRDLRTARERRAHRCAHP